MVIAMATIFLSSCEKNVVTHSNLEHDNQTIVSLTTGNLPSKKITLSDNLGNNVTLKVSTADEELLALYTDKIFKADFSQNESLSNDLNNVDIESNFLHDTSEETTRKVFIEIEELNLRNNTSFSITSVASNEIGLRHYNITTWYKAKSSSAIKVRCSGRGIDGLSAYGYQSTTAHCDAYWNSYSSKYFYNQNSGSKTFWRNTHGCLLVKTVGFHNEIITYIR